MSADESMDAYPEPPEDDGPVSVAELLATGRDGIVMSSTLGRLATSLAEANKEIEGVEKDGVNPHFRSKYATLAACLLACRGPLAKQGISVVQLPRVEGRVAKVMTILLHKSGEYIGSDLWMNAADEKPQSLGSAFTYGRRYGVSGVVGLAPEDDDGEAAQGRPMPPQNQARNNYQQRPSAPQANRQLPPPRQSTSSAPLRTPRNDDGPMLTDDDIPF